MRLRLVLPNEELTGIAPPAIERLARTAVAASDTHRGLIFLGCSLARYAVNRSTPPSARQDLLEALEQAERWARHPDADTRHLRQLRSRCFEGLAATEQKTVDAVRQSRTHMAPAPATLLDSHAAHVIERFARLSAYYAASSVLLVLDSTDEPARASAVIAQVAGGVAYQQVGFGAARSVELRTRAVDQAEFEIERLRDATPDPAALAVQIWHEYLGVQWKAHYDRQAHDLGTFALWATGAIQ